MLAMTDFSDRQAALTGVNAGIRIGATFQEKARHGEIVGAASVVKRSALRGAVFGKVRIGAMVQ